MGNIIQKEKKKKEEKEERANIYNYGKVIFVLLKL
jgi:hypothetical protein